MWTWIKSIVNKFGISNHTALILAVHALRSYLNLICEYELHSLSNKKVSGSKDHGKKLHQGQTAPGPPSLRNRLFWPNEIKLYFENDCEIHSD